MCSPGFGALNSPSSGLFHSFPLFHSSARFNASLLLGVPMPTTAVAWQTTGTAVPDGALIAPQPAPSHGGAQRPSDRGRRALPSPQAGSPRSRRLLFFNVSLRLPLYVRLDGDAR